MTSAGESVIKQGLRPILRPASRGKPGKEPANSSFHEAAWPGPRAG